MTSLWAWLDTSSDEQRRVRELIALFAQSESRDELGIGQIRDVFSDALFPGTSVVQTRARYFLFVPWIYRKAAERRSGVQLKVWADAQERQLIATLINDHRIGPGEGLIGRRAGVGLKILPSAIYWSGMVRYGILTSDVAADHLRVIRPRLTNDHELAERTAHEWQPSIPEPADSDFPHSVADGLDLRPAEASWLRERMLATTDGTLLAHLLVGVRSPEDAPGLPWDDASTGGATGPVSDLLEHARLFSLAMQGGPLLYNLLIAEQYEAQGFDRETGSVTKYRELLKEWEAECTTGRTALATWDRADFWDAVLSRNNRIGSSTRAFVDLWLDAACGGISNTATNKALRTLVASRERAQKKAQSRLDNERLLSTWSGSSGTARLDYRWGTVKRLILDIQEGLASAGT